MFPTPYEARRRTCTRYCTRCFPLKVYSEDAEEFKDLPFHEIQSIGHSAGGNALVYFMFVDPRVRVGVSSAGFFDLSEFYDINHVGMANPVFAIPGLVQIGTTADYLAFIAPRPFHMTRGSEETSAADTSKSLVASTESIEACAKQRYRILGVPERLKTIYFDGGHSFPDEVRSQAYQWLDAWKQATSKTRH